MCPAAGHATAAANRQRRPGAVDDDDDTRPGGSPPPHPPPPHRPRRRLTIALGRPCWPAVGCRCMKAEAAAGPNHPEVMCPSDGRPARENGVPSRRFYRCAMAEPRDSRWFDSRRRRSNPPAANAALLYCLYGAVSGHH
jgi:hypothetical protein